MSKFFPFGLNMRAGPSEPGIPKEGCPLEDHPKWTLVHGTGPSSLCWTNSRGTAFMAQRDEIGPINIAYNDNNFVNGTIGCVVAMVSTGSGDWLLPIAKFINENNILGTRWTEGKFEIVQRKVGTWTTLFSGGPTPAIGDEVLFIISSKYYKLIVNNTQIADGEHELAQDPGYWGVSQHRTPNLLGHTLCHDYIVSDASLARTPCMTSPTSPYGEVSASSEWPDPVDYKAWKGMNCTTVDARDAWISGEAQPMPQWIQWIGPSGQPAMVPDHLYIKGRAITPEHNTDYGPKKLTMLGTVDGQLWEEIQTWDNLDFGATNPMTLAINGTKAFIGIRLRVDEIRQTDPALICTQIGTWTVYGHAAELLGEWQVKYDGEIRDPRTPGLRLLDQGAEPFDDGLLKTGQALYFNGVDEHIHCPHPDLNNGDDFTILTTFESDDISINQGIFAAKNAFTRIRIFGSKIRCAVGTATGTKVIEQIPLPSGLVTVALVARSGVSMQVFVNGNLEGELAFNPEDTTSDLDNREYYIGCYSNNTEFFKGNISNVQIWNAAFDIDDIDFDYKYPEKLAYNRPGTSLSKDNLKAWWALTEGSGDTAFDWASNGIDGILTNFIDTEASWSAAAELAGGLQTVYMEYSLEAGVMKPLGSGGDDFPRDKNQLNFNGRSYIDCGNGPDVNPSTALIIEAIITQDLVRVLDESHYFIRKGDSYRIYAHSLNDFLYYRVTQTDASTTTVSSPFTISDGLTHFVFIFSPGRNLTCYKNGIEEGSEPLSGTGNLLIEPDNFSFSSGHDITTQIPLLNMMIDNDAQTIIDGDLDQWVTNLYQYRIDQGYLPQQVTFNGDLVTHNGEEVIE